MFKDKGCKGCRGVEYCCFMPIQIGEVKCPCYNCLVKGICSEQCELYDGYLKLAQSEVKKGFVLIAKYKNFISKKEYLVNLKDLECKFTMV